MNPNTQWATALQAVIDGRMYQAHEALGNLTVAELLELQQHVIQLTLLIAEICTDTADYLDVS